MINALRKGGPVFPVTDGGTGASDAPTARTNLGAGDFSSTQHTSTSHAGIPGVFTALQAVYFNTSWVNSSTPFSTGALGFTPKFMIVNGVASQNPDGTPTPAWNGTLATTFYGMAIGASNSQSGYVTSQHQRGGDPNDQCASFVPGFVGGSQPMGNVIGAAVTMSTAGRVLDVTAWSASGITISPNGTFTANAIIMVCG